MKLKHDFFQIQANPYCRPHGPPRDGEREGFHGLCGGRGFRGRGGEKEKKLFFKKSILSEKNLKNTVFLQCSPVQIGLATIFRFDDTEFDDTECVGLGNTAQKK